MTDIDIFLYATYTFIIFGLISSKYNLLPIFVAWFVFLHEFSFLSYQVIGTSFVFLWALIGTFTTVRFLVAVVALKAIDVDIWYQNSDYSFWLYDFIKQKIADLIGYILWFNLHGLKNL
ncbi:hypothetical protein [Haloferax larsenii]|uniref:hypothetical protein n=1 Tax=Haloferax larsenii TaxID=302484 RepID=UPI00111426B5|nr:hypothetical protein [Haloferax larsenii]